MTKRIVIPNTRHTNNYGSFMMLINALHYLTKNYRSDLTFYVELESKKDKERLMQEIGQEYNIKILKPVPVKTNKSKIVNNFKRTIGFLKQTKRIIDLKPDITIFLGGDNFSEYYKKWKIVVELFCTYLISKKNQTILLGQTVGPFFSWRKIVARKLLSNTTIYTRDDLSAHYLKILGFTNVKKSNDLAFLDLPRQHEKKILTKYELKPNSYFTIVPSGLYDQYCNSYDEYIDCWVEILINLLKNNHLKNKKIVLLAHAISKTRTDDKKVISDILSKLNKLYSSNNRIIPITNLLLASQVRSILGNGFFTISGKMHATISTFQMRKPAIALSYSIKYQGVIGEQLKTPELIIEAADASLWKPAVISKLVERKIEYVSKNYKNIVSRTEKEVQKIKKDLNSELKSLLNNFFLNNL